MIGAWWRAPAFDVGVDLGAARCRAVRRRDGAVVDLPALVLYRGEAVAAVGASAAPFVGRVPEGHSLVRPVRAGEVVYPAAAAVVIQAALDALDARRARVALAVDDQAVGAPWRALASRGRWGSSLVSRSAAAAAGCGAREEDAAVLLVDIGASCTRISLLQRRRAATTALVEVGGVTSDAAVTRWAMGACGVELGPATAEQVKRLARRGAPIVIAGRCVETGLPRATSVSGDDVLAAACEPGGALGVTILRLLREGPHEVVAAAVQQGVMLLGGGARLDGLDDRLRRETGVLACVADEPDTAVLRGLALHDALLPAV